MGRPQILSEVDFRLAKTQKSDLTYKYHQKADDDFKVLTEENVGDESLDKTIPTLLFIHGWSADDTAPWYGLLREEYSKLGAYNIIYIDWSKPANVDYEISCANVKPLGRFIAQFLIASGIPCEKIHIISHSLGSHLAGFTGKFINEFTGKKIGRLTALDPAGPKFEHPKMTSKEKLCENDAEFVDVIHTDAGHFGFTKPIGHVDFYPNQGKEQPGCAPGDHNCNHARSPLYFIESVSEKIEASEATFNENNSGFTVSPKVNGKVVIFGQHVDKNSKGVYYLKTNSQKPFLT